MRVVHERDAQPLAEVEAQRLGFGELLAVERPDEALHVAGEMQLDLAPRLAPIDRTADRVQIGVSQHAPAVVAQADARIVEAGRA